MVLYTETQEHKTHVNFEKDTYIKYQPSIQCVYLANEYNKNFDFQHTFQFTKINKIYMKQFCGQIMLIMML